MRDATETKRRRNGSARLQSCRQSRNPTHSVIPNEVWDLLFPSARLLRDVLCSIARLSRDVLCSIARLLRDESAFSSSRPRPDATARKSTRRGTACRAPLPLSTFNSRLSTSSSPTALPRRRILRAEHALRIVLPDPRVDEPGRFGNEVAALFGALGFGQAVRIVEAGQHADVVVLMPKGQ